MTRSTSHTTYDVKPVIYAAFLCDRYEGDTLLRVFSEMHSAIRWAHAKDLENIGKHYKGRHKRHWEWVEVVELKLDAPAAEGYTVWRSPWWVEDPDAEDTPQPRGEGQQPGDGDE